jgi:hypothetical protein
MFIKNIKKYLRLFRNNADRLHKIQEALGRIELRQVASASEYEMLKTEFRVFSQWGEDGIIQGLIRLLGPIPKIFIEFGVQDYCESNTRFLLINNNWSGLIIDGSEDNIKNIKSDNIYWQYNLKADCSFITRENINDIFKRNGIKGDIGLLSIDIDGNDYWVWESIDSVNPAIVVTEYNARFGIEGALSVPYDPNFIRSTAHFSHIYYGASLRAMCFLANKKNYLFVGCNMAGNNAFFVRKDLLKHPLRELTLNEGFKVNQFREARNANGELAFLSNEDEMKLLRDLPFIDVSTGKTQKGLS